MHLPLLILFIFWQQTTAWRLKWSDEFNGNTLNTTNWRFDVNANFNNELQRYTNSTRNIQVTNGNLIITAIPENQIKNGKRYTSGRIQLKTESFCYGKFVVKARLPKGKHLWPAIWMLPSHDWYGAYPASGEIDIMEYRGQKESTIESTLHFGGTVGNQASNGSGEIDVKIDLSAEYHEYGIIWNQNEMLFILDDKWYHRELLNRSFYSGKGINPYNNIRQPFDKAFQFVLNVAVGGNFFPPYLYGELSLEEAKAWPKPTMEIDWIRVYETSGNKTYPSKYPLRCTLQWKPCQPGISAKCCSNYCYKKPEWQQGFCTNAHV